MKLITVFAICIPILATGCLKNDQTEVAGQPADASCTLKPGVYPVQSATHHASQGSYSLILLNAPACLKQPVDFPALKLQRLAEGEQERAQLEFDGKDDPVLHIAADFKIDLIQAVEKNGQVTREETSSWTPFLAGAAGAAVGGMVANKLFNKPQYYLPPPAQPGGGPAQGVGGYGDTREGAIRSYERKYQASPPVSQSSNGFFKKKVSADEATGQSKVTPASKVSSGQGSANKGFFKKKRR